MQNTKTFLMSLIFAVAGSTVLQAADLPPTGARPAATSVVRYTPLAKLKESLPAKPVVAGFDIDDTVVFSSPGFYFGEHNTDGPGGKNRYGDDYLRNPQFWKDLNQYHDRYSMKKRSGDELIRMHRLRGDTIVFITKRFCYDDDAPIIARRLNRMFGIDSKVYCTDEQPKTPWLAETGVDIYYGDSDTDIEYARAVKTKKVRAVRVERNGASTYTTNYNPGMLGEEVLANSAD